MRSAAKPLAMEHTLGATSLGRVSRVVVLLARVPRVAVLLAFVLALGSGCSEDASQPLPPARNYPPPDPVTIVVPGLPPMPVPADNPTTRQGIALGRQLFYDTRLSGDGTMACATCHQQRFAFSDGGRRFSIGIDGIPGNFNAPQLTNVAFAPQLFWNGRAASLEEQAREPVTDPIEMHTTWPDVVARLRQDPSYADLFGAAFGTADISEDRIVQAIAQFQRTLVSYDSPYDRWISRGAPYPADARRGWQMFFTEVGDCFHCHNDQFSFTIQEFRDNGLDAQPDSGRATVTGQPTDVGKHKIPTLRNVAVTAPYMHDGRFDTLEQVLDHYDGGFHRSPNLDPQMLKRQNPLTPQQRSDIIAFLHTLTDSTFLTKPEFANPFPQ